MQISPTCPSCRNPMQMHALPGNHGHNVELDLCFQCQGIWFDPKAVEMVLEGYAHASKGAGRLQPAASPQG